MATQAQVGSQQYQWSSTRNSSSTSGGIIGQIFAVFTRPKSFFQRMPYTRHWLFAALVILGAAGYTAVNQTSTVTQSTTANAAIATPAAIANVSQQPNDVTAPSTQLTTEAGSSATNQSTGGFAPPAASSSSSASSAPAAGNTDSANTTTAAGTTAQSTPSASARNNTARASAGTAATAAATTTTDSSSPTVLVLFAVGGLLATWFGQALLLSLVPMLNGYAPSLGRGFQLAVWASLPFAVMLILRQVNFSAGGTGGSIGLSALLSQWSDFNKLGELAQRIITTFMSNLTLFWLWNLALLYMGARFALKGSRLSAILIICAWIVTSSIVPALITNPVTSVAPKATTTVSTQQNTNTTTTTNNTASTTQMGGDFMASGGMSSGGNFAGGAPPSGGGAPPGN